MCQKDKYVQVVIVSAKDPNDGMVLYEVLFDDSPVDWEFFTYRLERIVKFYEENYKMYVFMEGQPMYEEALTKAFCDFANHFLSRQYFVPGTQKECKWSYRNKRWLHCKSVFNNEFNTLIFFNDSEINTEFKRYPFKLDKAYSELKPTFRNYTIFIKYLIDQHSLDVNGYVPIIRSSDLPLIMGGHPWAFPDNIINSDKRILNYASGDPLFFIECLIKGGTKITYEPSCCGPDSNISDIIFEAFPVCNRVSQYMALRKFIEREIKFLKDFYINDGENLVYGKLLLAEYKCLINLNIFYLFKRFCERFFHSLIKILINYNPFSGEWIKEEKDIMSSCQIIPSDQCKEITNYVLKNILPAVEMKRRMSSYIPPTDNWGINSVTGGPITRSQLSDIDSQKWW